MQAKLAREANVAAAEAVIATGQAQLVNANEQLTRTRADHRRSELLVSKSFVSARESDRTESLLNQAEAAQKVALATIRQSTATHAAAREDVVAVVVNRRAIQANVEAARAAVRLAAIHLENTRIRAPRDGQVGEIGVKLGQYATPGTQLLALVPEQSGWLPISRNHRPRACNPDSSGAPLLRARERQAAWTRRAHFARHRVRVQCHPSRQRDRQLHQDRSAPSCVHSHR